MQLGDGDWRIGVQPLVQMRPRVQDGIEEV